MKTVSLSGSPRENVGKKDAVNLRRAGRVPAVLYGGETQTHFSVDAIELKKITHSPDVYQIDLDIDGQVSRAIIQDAQYHPVSDRPLHVDFLQCFEDKPVVVGLPVRTVGVAPGVVGGGGKRMNFRKLNVRALAAKLPEYIELDISNLEIGDAIRVREIELEGCEILHPPSAVVVAVKVTRAAMSAAADETLEGEAAEAEGEGEGGEESAAE